MIGLVGAPSSTGELLSSASPPLFLLPVCRASCRAGGVVGQVEPPGGRGGSAEHPLACLVLPLVAGREGAPARKYKQTRLGSWGRFGDRWAGWWTDAILGLAPVDAMPRRQVVWLADASCGSWSAATAKGRTAQACSVNRKSSRTRRAIDGGASVGASQGSATVKGCRTCSLTRSCRTSSVNGGYCDFARQSVPRHGVTDAKEGGRRREDCGEKGGVYGPYPSPAVGSVVDGFRGPGRRHGAVSVYKTFRRPLPLSSGPWGQVSLVQTFDRRRTRHDQVLRSVGQSSPVCNDPVPNGTGHSRPIQVLQRGTDFVLSFSAAPPRVHPRVTLCRLTAEPLDAKIASQQRSSPSVRHPTSPLGCRANIHPRQRRTAQGFFRFLGFLDQAS